MAWRRRVRHANLVTRLSRAAQRAVGTAGQESNSGQERKSDPETEGRRVQKAEEEAAPQRDAQGAGAQIQRGKGHGEEAWAVLRGAFERSGRCGGRGCFLVEAGAATHCRPARPPVCERPAQQETRTGQRRGDSRPPNPLGSTVDAVHKSAANGLVHFRHSPDVCRVPNHVPDTVLGLGEMAEN